MKNLGTYESACGSERILLVEDYENLREITTRTLRKQGYEVVEAKDGAEAVNLLKECQPFDLLFTDVYLPGSMNGVEIAEEAKRIQPGIKILYTTEDIENAVVRNRQLDPGVNLVKKPYLREELLGKVHELLDSGDG